MFHTIPAVYEWLSPWVPLTDEDEEFAFGQALSEFPGKNIASKLHDELQRETCCEHALYGLSTKAVAYCSQDANEVLFLTNHAQFRIACVHLTWKRESSSSFPHFDGYANLDSWTAQMRREHERLTHKRGV